MIPPTQFAILCGHEGSGVAGVARLLARHPEVEVFARPDAGNLLERTRWTRWAPDQAVPALFGFLAEMLVGVLDPGFAGSDAFVARSTSLEVVPGRLHVLETTALELKVGWLTACFPDVPVHAVIGEPRATLAAVLGDDAERRRAVAAFDAMTRFVMRDAAIGEPLRRAALDARGDEARAAAVLAVRTRALLDAVPPERVLRVAEVAADPDRVLGELVVRYGRSAGFGFARFVADDLGAAAAAEPPPPLAPAVDAIFAAAGLLEG